MTVGVGLDVVITGGLTAQVSRLDLRVGGNLALSLHSSNELSELSQWPCHDDNTISILLLLFHAQLGVHSP